MQEKEKRKVRGYKCQDSPYRKALKRAQKEKTSLAAFIEKIVIAYASGHEIEIFGDREKRLIGLIDKHKNEINDAVGKTVC